MPPGRAALFGVRLQIVDNSLTSYNPPPSTVPPIHNKNPPEMTEEFHRSPMGQPGADAGQGLWQACVEQLAQDLPEPQFNTWIKPLVAQVAEDFSKVTLLVANRFKLDWIRAQYAGRIAALLEALYGQSKRLS